MGCHREKEASEIWLLGGSSTWMLPLTIEGIRVERKIALQLPKPSVKKGRGQKLSK